MQEDGSELVKERPRRYEVAGFHDDRRQDDSEEQLCVELDDCRLIAAEVRYYSEDDADHDQKTTLRAEVLETFTGMKTCTIYQSNN